MKTEKEKLETIKNLLESAQASVDSAYKLISDLVGDSSKKKISAKASTFKSNGEIVEGIFDGENMIGPNKKVYPVPQNYASKSKLIEGDVLKLTILEDGSFVFKQIGPVERKKVIGVLAADGDQYKVLVDSKSYKVLLASVTYFKAKIGDQVALVIPKEEDSNWGAIEMVLGTPES